jgi:hypothetical protein
MSGGLAVGSAYEVQPRSFVLLVERPEGNSAASPDRRDR